MRRIVAWLIISLDGVVESPESWSSPYLTDEVNAEIGAGVAQRGTVLLGRRTYQEMADYWPHQGSDVPFADNLNNSHKYVVSATLDRPVWANSSSAPACACSTRRPIGRVSSSSSPRRTAPACCAPATSRRGCSTPRRAPPAGPRQSRGLHQMPEHAPR
jgi:hypothetical protein